MNDQLMRMKSHSISGTYNSEEMSMLCNGYDENDSLKDEHSSDDASGSLDAPLDFSMKRKSIDSESDSHSMVSPASSINQDNPRSHESGSNLYNGYSVNPNGEKFGQRTPGYHSNSPSPNSQSPVNVAKHIPGYTGVVPNSQLSGHFDTTPNPVDNKKFSQPNGTNKSSRPFKAYPRELLNMPIGYYGGVAPGYSPHMDNNIIHAINNNTEELMKMYKNQIDKIRDIEQQKTICSPPSLVNNTSVSSIHSSPPHSPVPTSTTNLNDIRNSVSIISPGARKRAKSLPDDQKDEAYWERRRKNNEAAKRSRDARRAKEDEIAIRAALLEQENLKLRVEVAALKNETAKLRCLLYQS